MTDAVGNTSNSVTRHANNEVIKQGITTFADGKHAVVYDGKSDISIFLGNLTGEKYSEEQINNFIIKADRQNDDIEYKGTRSEKLITPLQEGDVLILNENNTMTVNQYKLELKEKEQKEAINEKYKAKKAEIAKRKKKTIGWGIGGTGGVIAVGLGIAALCVTTAAVATGLGIAAGAVAVVTGAVLGIRALVNSFKKDNAELDELKEQQEALEND